MVTAPHSKEASAHALSPEVQEAVVRLAQGVLSVRPLIDVLDHPIHVAPIADSVQLGVEGVAGLERLLGRIALRSGSPEFKVLDAAAHSSLTVFEQVVSERLRNCGPYEAALQLTASASPEIDPIIDAVIQEDFDCKFNCTAISSFDGAVVKAYTAGEPRDEAVIIISACGMPARLCEPWMSFLAKNHFVLTWETRGLFGQLSNSDALAWDVSAQAKDLFAVMDHFGVKAGHVMGLCGGAIIAATAASTSRERVSSLSVWYGDFELGSASPKTMYQQNLKDVMLMAGAGRSEASATHELFCGAMVKNVRSDLAHLILYPYATAELLFRYGKLNGSIMSTNVDPMLGKILQRTLVVTSEDDSTAHPAASRHVAARLPDAVLHVEPHGDHLSFYEAGPGLTELAGRFLAGKSI